MKLLVVSTAADPTKPVIAATHWIGAESPAKPHAKSLRHTLDLQATPAGPLVSARVRELNGNAAAHELHKVLPWLVWEPVGPAAG